MTAQRFMKYVIRFAFSLFVFLGITGCGGESNNTAEYPENPQKLPSGDVKTLGPNDGTSVPVEPKK